LNQLWTLNGALAAVDSVFGHDSSALTAAFGSVTFTYVNHIYKPDGAPSLSDWIPGKAASGVITITPNATQTNMVHEMGHMFDTGPLRSNSRASLLSQVFVTEFNGGSCMAGPCYEGGGWSPKPGGTTYGEQSSLEDFADSFAATIRNDGSVNVARVQAMTALIEMYTEPYPR
jgi:hypothetical protein